MWCSVNPGLDMYNAKRLILFELSALPLKNAMEWPLIWHDNRNVHFFKSMGHRYMARLTTAIDRHPDIPKA